MLGGIRIEIEDCITGGRDVLVIQEAGIPGPQGIPGDISNTNFELPLEYLPAPDYLVRIKPGTVVGEVIQWDGSSWVPTTLPPQRVEYRSVTALEEASKEIVLAHALSDPDSFLFDIKHGGGAQFPGADFIIDGNAIKWAGLALDGVLSEGDQIRLVYQ